MDDQTAGDRHRFILISASHSACAPASSVMCSKKSCDRLLLCWRQVPGLTPPDLGDYIFDNRGAAIECRLNAENPSANYSPSSGNLPSANGNFVTNKMWPIARDASIVQDVASSAGAGCCCSMIHRSIWKNAQNP